MSVLRRLLGTGVLATAMMLPEAMGSIRVIMGMGLSYTMSPGEPSGAGSALGVVSAAGGSGAGCPITPWAYRVGSSPSCRPCYPWGQKDLCP